MQGRPFALLKGLERQVGRFPALVVLRGRKSLRVQNPSGSKVQKGVVFGNVDPWSDVAEGLHHGKFLSKTSLTLLPLAGIDTRSLLCQKRVCKLAVDTGTEISQSI